METTLCILLAACLLLNACAFAAMGIDKRRARRGAWRIPERTLWLWALPFSAPGAYAGMRVFHHKTRHAAFRYGMPALALVQVAMAVLGAVYALKHW